MKSRIFVSLFSLSVAILSLLLGGCTGSNESETTGSFSENNSAVVSQSKPESSDLGNTENPESNNPEEKTPDGEPTFLTAPDGTPVYTSEVSEVYSGSEFDDNKETLTLAQAEQYARACDGEFTVKCDGFAYGFIPERALNRADDPEMFKGTGDGEIYEFLGSEDKFSADYIRINVGDKFGSLTVKSAYTLFSDDRFLESFSEIPGAYISGGAIEFDGETELTGYVNVWEDSDYQGAGGTMVFYPDGGSGTKIPVISYEYSDDGRKIHRSEPNSSGYFGDWWCSLGNMSEVDCDTSGLHKGDVFVKVKITADNVTSGFGGVQLKLKGLEVL